VLARLSTQLRSLSSQPINKVIAHQANRGIEERLFKKFSIIHIHLDELIQNITAGDYRQENHNEIRLIPLDFMSAGRNFYLIRRKSHQLSPVMKAFIKTMKNLPAAR
jgi:hypothetical protein